MTIYTKTIDNTCLICGNPALRLKKAQAYAKKRLFSETCGQSCQAKLARKRLREDPEKFASFCEKTRRVVSNIWAARDTSEKQQILNGARKGWNSWSDSLTPEERRKKTSRYYRCDSETIERLNTLGAEQLMKNNGTPKNGGYVATFKGRFVPKNIKKYSGDWKNIIHRSGWERQIMKYLDETESVLEWSSEEIVIPYRDPFEGHQRRYFPDFWIKVKKADGTISEYLWEVKPACQTIQPILMEGMTKAGKRRHYLNTRTFVINSAKWKAAEQYCESRGWKFQLVTENDLSSMGGGKRKKNK